MGGWLAGLTETKTKPNPKLRLELKFGAELCNKIKTKCKAYQATLDMELKMALYIHICIEFQVVSHCAMFQQVLCQF